VVANLKTNTPALVISWLDSLRRRELVRNVAVLTIGTVLAQAVTLFVAPILSRLYDPSAFGVYGVYVSLVGFVSVVACGRYELALLLPEKDSDAMNLLALCFGILTVMVLAAFCAVALLGATVVEAFAMRELASWLWWIPVSLLFAGSFQTLSYWTTRAKRFSQISTSKMVQSVARAATQTGAGLVGLHAGGLIGGGIVGQFMGSLILAAKTDWPDESTIYRSLQWKKMMELARQHKGFPLFNGPEAVVNVAAQYAPVVLFAFFFDALTAGLYMMAHRLVRIPAELLGESVRQTFFQAASKIRNAKGDMYAPFVKTTIGLAIIGAVPFCLVVAFGPRIFEVALGSQWGRAGEFARWLALWLFWGLIIPPSVVIGLVCHKQRFLFVWDLLLSLSQVLALLVGAHLNSPHIAVAAYCVTGAIFEIFLIFYTWNRLRQSTLTLQT